MNPNLGSLTWVSVCVPTKYGNIVVNVENRNLEIFVPKETTLEWRGKLVVGTKLYKVKY